MRYRLAPNTPAESPLTIQIQLDRFELPKPYRVYWQVSRADIVQDE
jgi:hypothetical protein